MSLNRIALITVCAAAIGFGLVQASKSQNMMGGQGTMGAYIGISGTQMTGNVSSVWLLDSSNKQIIACKYQLDARITCAKQELP
jgi:hypothetical protein